MKKYIIGLVILGLFIIPSFSLAQTPDPDPNPTESDCVALQSTNLRYRARDANTNGEVSTLQDFLQSKNYLNSDPTGYFGILTLKAVKDFQRDNNINPTGYVGAITRAKISSLTGCNGIITTTPTTPPYDSGCLYGQNYSSTTGQKCTTSTSTTPVISSVSGPQTLNVNQQGTWEVKASSSNGGSLSYSVVWGDEVYATTRSSQPTASQSPQQSATFTHTYSTAGTYTPVFTVTNTSGQSAKTSLSVKVGNVITTPSITVLSPNGGETYKIGDKIIVKWSTKNMSSSELVGISILQSENGADKVEAFLGHTANDGIEIFNIPTNLASGKYLIFIYRSSGHDDNRYAEDNSDNYFTIISLTPTKSLKITNPLGGHLWTIGDAQTFQWTTNEIASSVVGHIDLVGNGSTYRIYNVSNTGSYEWNPVGNANGVSVPAGTYSVKIIMDNIGDVQGPLTIVRSTVIKPQLSVSLVSDLVVPSSVLPGSTNLTLLKLKLAASGGDVFLDQIVVDMSNSYSLSNIRARDFSTGTLLGKVDSLSNYDSIRGYYWASIIFTQPYIIIGKDTIKTIEILADVTTLARGSLRLNLNGLAYDNYTELTTSLPILGPSINVSLTPTNSNPVLNLIVVPSGMTVGKSYDFTFSATDADNDNLCWTIKWGDSMAGGMACSTSNLQQKQGWTYNPNHTWNTAGTYIVSITVSDNKGGTASSTFSVTVVEIVSPGISGDVNGDGSVTCVDVNMILDSVVGKLLLTTDQKNRADVDGNGYVQAYDASLLMQQFGLSCLTVGSLLGSSLTANALGALNEENLQTNKAPTFVESSCGKFTKTLSKGMVNEEVKCLQKMLGEKGFKVEGIESGKETTLFGYNTLMALKKFQTSNGLTADGIFGLATREALKK